jgi:glycosyltransferase involved in cell wall biosynthesis
MQNERKLRMGLIGPTLPYRSGIAQHTTMLHRALRSKTELTTLSFTRQYPGWLFPGESDRDPFHEGHREPGVEYLIDSLDPRTWARAVKRLRQAEVEAVVVPWWTVYFAPCFSYFKAAFRRQGLPLVFLCHNVIEHEAALYKTLLSKLVLSGARGYCVQSRAEAGKLTRMLPRARVLVHPHPLYDQFPPAQQELPRRANLELLFFGIVRPYKGLDVLLEAMALLERKDVQLSVVGEFWRDKEPTLKRIAELDIDGRVEVVPRFVSEQEAADYFARADAIVLPYRSASGTGIIPMAYHYGKPVIATRIGGLEDAVSDGKTGFLVDPESPRALAAAIDRVSGAELRALRPQIDAFKASMTWEGLADVLIELCEPAERA